MVTDVLDAMRSAARSFEETLPQKQRKRLGQFFTGLPLGRLLAELALEDTCRTVVDPMAGHGNLLDAVAMAATAKGQRIERLDGMEVDGLTADFCQRRAASLGAAVGAAETRILSGSAFDPATVGRLQPDGYDLVITNPPYVRYQSQSRDTTSMDGVRRGLAAIIDARHSGAERTLWKVLVDGYSGLADLSVPAWILAALLTRPGGRLALVVPATWRSRDYAYVIRYLMLRFFDLEFVVADTQPGWFSDALVRTHLIVARRLAWDRAAPSLAARASWSPAQWLEVAPTAADQSSLVGAAFPGPCPEAAFATCSKMRMKEIPSVVSQAFDLQEEWQLLQQRLRRKYWFQAAEGQTTDTLPVLACAATGSSARIPERLREMLPSIAISANLQTLEEAGICVSQGLRTGCNRFFYVTVLADEPDGDVIVETSDTFQGMPVRIPKDALRPVLHRQADMPAFAQGHALPTRVLNLSNWVLAEDQPAVLQALGAYQRRGIPVPRLMPDGLADFVRRAATQVLDPAEPARLIPTLSAVRTNVRLPTGGRDVPRFWYMLPAFTARHQPAIFTPRINHGVPAVALNTSPPTLIDANFSTFWAEGTRWTSHALYALFNSSWCRAGMEAVGTPMGGGALKLEATHIRQLPIPPLSDDDRRKFDALGRQLATGEKTSQGVIDKLVLRAVSATLEQAALAEAAALINARLQAARTARQRIAL